MRVTSAEVLHASQRRLQSTMVGIERLREDIASGVKVRRMSDDPAAASDVVRVGSALRALTQHKRNVDLGVAKAQAEESALDSLGSVLTRAYEIGLAQSGSTANQSTRGLARAEVDRLVENAVTLGNTRFGDDYLFGGNRSGEAPFRVPASPAQGFSNLTKDGLPVNPAGASTIEIGAGRFISPAHNGTEVFLDTDALESLRALSTALGDNNREAIEQASARAQAAFSSLQERVTESGARLATLQDTALSLGGQELQLVSYRSGLRDTDVETAMTELIGKQTIYQAAMSATSRILGLSLANYL
ncbi:MAG: hypothetical protein KJT01_07365 [Gemmatimonadetes bacterium]|nr:hypothetical protein [Gemmatimonadota bacterium]